MTITKQSRIVKRSIVLNGHKTSVSLEDVFFDALKAMAKARGVSLSCLVGEIDSQRKNANLSSAIRIACLEVAGKAPDPIDQPFTA